MLHINWRNSCTFWQRCVKLASVLSCLFHPFIKPYDQVVYLVEELGLLESDGLMSGWNRKMAGLLHSDA